MELTNSSLVVVLGPTGSGKSSLALALAQKFQAEIVNYDSVQVYRGLDIGSAKTSTGARQGIRHHLLDVAEPSEDFTAGTFAARARTVLDEIARRGVLSVLVGGTGFYLRSLLDGLSPAPTRNVDLRARLNTLVPRRPAALHRFLHRIDTAAAERIHPNDHQKLIRAIELATAISSPLPREPLLGFRVLKIGLNPNRAELYQRLNARSAAMFQQGLLEETSGLLAAGIPENSKALQSLGYKQAVAVLAGRISREEAIADLQIKTRQYAKRQMTWFRREQNVQWLEGFGEVPEITQEALSLVSQFLKNDAS